MITLLVWAVGSSLNIQFAAKTHAMIVKTHSDERLIAASLQEHMDKTGGLTNLTKQFILDSIFASNQNQIWLNTNATGDLIDIWQTPYQIELAGPTNFVVRSAGKDLKFGDSDDIVFNGALNDFVKP